tara:strand:- start:198 stop:569 length:372 start_codon:yes stop_codon:yes gene_type:complete
MANVVFKICKLFQETYIAKAQENPLIKSKFEEFKRTKMDNPMQPFGAKDYPLGNNAPLGQSVPKLRHSGLNSDISIFYTVSGANPTVIHLYGLFSHDDSGTGQPANIKKQKSLGSKLSNQSFQ